MRVVILCPAALHRPTALHGPAALHPGNPVATPNSDPCKEMGDVLSLERELAERNIVHVI